MINGDFLFSLSLDSYKDWTVSSKSKYLNSTSTVKTSDGEVRVKLIKLQRHHQTIGKLALAILLTLGTCFLGLCSKKIRNLWTGKETKKIALYEGEVKKGHLIRTRNLEKTRKISQLDDQIMGLQTINQLQSDALQKQIATNQLKEDLLTKQASDLQKQITDNQLKEEFFTKQISALKNDISDLNKMNKGLAQEVTSNAFINQGLVEREFSSERAALTILRSPYGFSKDETVDQKYVMKKDSTFTECHGRVELRQKVIPFSLSLPSALSTINLRKYSSTNYPLYCSIMFKRLAHAFSLEGHVTIQNQNLFLEGFNETFAIPMLINSLTRYMKEKKANPELFAWLQLTLKETIWHENVTDEKIDSLHRSIQDPRNTLPAVIGSGYDWHSNYVIIDQDQLFLCDRGGVCKDKGIYIFTIVDKTKITPQFLKDLANRTAFNANNCLTTLLFTANAETLLNVYGLKIERKFRMKPLKAGICTYANFKAALYVLFSLYTKRSHPTLTWERNFGIGKAMYKDFSCSDKEFVLEDFITEISLPSTEIGAMKSMASKLKNKISGLNEKKIDPTKKQRAYAKLSAYTSI